jgi:hypothetical protein
MSTTNESLHNDTLDQEVCSSNDTSAAAEKVEKQTQPPQEEDEKEEEDDSPPILVEPDSDLDVDTTSKEQVAQFSSFSKNLQQRKPAAPSVQQATVVDNNNNLSSDPEVDEDELSQKNLWQSLLSNAREDFSRFKVGLLVALILLVVYVKFFLPQTE